MKLTKHISFLFLILVTVAYASAVPVYAKKTGAPVISKITIYATDIFDLETKPYLRKIPYTWINTLHIQTNEKIIRQELLFEEGDILDPFLIQETERNLRSLSFIRAARINQYPQRDGSVALVVFVNDSWTTEPQLNLSGSNGIDEVEFGFKEKNLFGWGKSIQVLHSDNDDTNETTMRYTDPRLFSSRWALTAEAIKKKDGKERNFSMDRPFFSSETRWSSSLSHRHDEQEVEEFQNNRKISEFERTTETGEASVGLKLNQSNIWVHRAGLRYKKEAKRFARNPETDPNRALPRSQDFQTLFLDWSTTHNNYMELTRIEKMTRVEDFNQGPVLSISPGFSPRALTGRNDVSEMETSFSQNIYHPSGVFLRNELSYAGRDVFENAVNEAYIFSTRAYFLSFPDHTLVARVRAQWGDSLDTDNLVRVGSEEGLRAYNRNEVFGSKSFVFNLEDRLFFIDDLWQLFSVGAVVYYDTGYAWSSGRPVALSDMLHNVGTGLRLGMTKSSNELIARIDFSYRLTRSIHDDDEFVISFGSGQAF